MDSGYAEKEREPKTNQRKKLTNFPKFWACKILCPPSTLSECDLSIVCIQQVLNSPFGKKIYMAFMNEGCALRMSFAYIDYYGAFHAQIVRNNITELLESANLEVNTMERVADTVKVTISLQKYQISISF